MAVSFAVPMLQARADTQYNATDAAWNLPDTWLPVGVPRAGDSVSVIAAIAAGTSTVSLGTYVTPFLADVRVGSGGGTMNVNVDGATARLNVLGILNVGSIGAGTVQQTGTTSSVNAGSLIVGDTAASGVYTQSGGILTISGQTNIGVGQGTFNANAGTTNLLDIYAGAGALGSGVINVAGGRFNATTIGVGMAADQTVQGTGSVVLSAGFLTTNSMILSSKGSFLQTGGILTVAGLFDARNANGFAFKGGQMVIDGGEFRAPQQSIDVSVGNSVVTFNNAFMVSGTGFGTSQPTLWLVGGSTFNMAGAGSATLLIGTSVYQGIVIVSGAGSLLSVPSSPGAGSGIIEVGIGSGTRPFDAGSGQLTATAGGHIEASTAINVGDAGGRGTVLITGTGSSLATPGLHIGVGQTMVANDPQASNGSLTVSGGGSVVTSTLTIGSQGGTGVVTVTDRGSTLVADELNIGDSGSFGSFRVTGDGLVTIKTVNIGKNGGTAGLNLIGAGTGEFRCTTLNVGDPSGTIAGIAGISISGSQTLVVSGATTFFREPAAFVQPISFSMSGGTFRSHDIDFSGVTNLPFFWSGGKVVLTGGHLRGASTLTISRTMVFSGTGTVHGDLTIASSFETSDDRGLLHVMGNFASTSGAQLVFDIVGTAPDEYQHFLVDGNVSLGGLIFVEFLNNNVKVGDSFQLFSFQSFTDQGYQILVPGLPAGMTLDHSAFATTGIVTIVPEPASCVLLAMGGLALLRRRRETPTPLNRSHPA